MLGNLHTASTLLFILGEDFDFFVSGKLAQYIGNHLLGRRRVIHILIEEVSVGNQFVKLGKAFWQLDQQRITGLFFR